MLQSLRDTCQRANMFQKTCKTLGHMKIIVCKISPGGGGGETIYIPCPINALFYLLLFFSKSTFFENMEYYQSVKQFRSR